ncbi:PGF-CTERM sorting domain-containing protein [Natronomonas amylolytica]|uniref:PGF-CTERM sorting domain-containing protein n=1 Tax=Natronomonas amylolytica TaxID=3108498 RepID=UPI0030096AC3
MRITNPDARSETTLRVTHADANVSTHAVTLGTEEPAELELDVTFEEPNEGVVEVNGHPAGELTVDSGDGEEGAPPTEPADQPGFGALVALFAVLVGTLWAWRGRDETE